MEAGLNHEKAYRGENYRERLARHRLVICGAGAVGSLLTDTLVRSGMTPMRIIDRERVEEANLGTQLYGHNDVGAYKVAALQAMMYRNLRAEIHGYADEMTTTNSKKLLRDASVAVDAFDNTDGRKLVQNACRIHKLPCLHIGVSQDAFGSVIWDQHYRVPPDPGGQAPCDIPLARTLILLTVVTAAEEILDFCLANKPRLQSWTITLADLAIRPMKV